MPNPEKNYKNELRRSKLSSRTRLLSENALTNAEFLEATQAVPAPPELYAHWLAVWLKKGGKIHHHREWKNYSESITRRTRGHSKGAIGANGLVLEAASAPDYESQAHFGVWTPTVNTDESIPVGYGSSSMKLLVVTDLTPIPDAKHVLEGHKTAGLWGHTTVMTLGKRSLFSGLDASINQEHGVESFPDIEELIMEHKLSQLKSLGRDALKKTIKPVDK